MIDYRKILFLYFEEGLSNRSIANALGCSKTTVGEFLSRFEALREKNEISYPLSDEMSNEALGNLLYKSNGSKEVEEQFRPIDYEAVLKSLKRKGETLKRQWRKYDAVGIVDGKKPYSYRRYCEKITEFCSKNTTIGHILRRPGENIELDFAGKTLSFYRVGLEKEGGVKVTIFGAALTYSGFFYCEGMTECDEKNWIRVCNNALYYFGGVTPHITPDNAKVAVKNNRDWVSPEINETFQNWADYYGTVILPAAVRSPTWKPKIENTIGIITRDILLDMDEMKFYSINELNQELWRRMEERNRENFIGKDYSRRDIFERDELPLLKKLPEHPFSYLQRAVVKVYPDLSIVFDNNHYLVNKKYVGSALEVRASEEKVMIYTLKNDLVKSYDRRYGYKEWVYDEDTKPKTSSDYSAWSPSYFKERALKIGPNTKKVIERMLESKDIPSKSFRACWGILTFAEKYGKEELELVAAAALYRGRISYGYIKDMLSGDALLEEKAKATRKNRDSNIKEEEMKYKVSSSSYSLSSILLKQEELFNEKK